MSREAEGWWGNTPSRSTKPCILLHALQPVSPDAHYLMQHDVPLLLLAARNIPIPHNLVVCMENQRRRLLLCPTPSILLRQYSITPPCWLTMVKSLTSHHKPCLTTPLLSTQQCKMASALYPPLGSTPKLEFKPGTQKHCWPAALLLDGTTARRGHGSLVLPCPQPKAPCASAPLPYPLPTHGREHINGPRGHPQPASRRLGRRQRCGRTAEPFALAPLPLPPAGSSQLSRLQPSPSGGGSAESV